MALAINFDADVAMATEDLPTTITISGSDYSAVVSEVTRGEQVELEGVLIDVDARAVIRTSVLTAPSIASRVTINSRQFRIVRIVESPCSSCYQLDLAALTK